MNAEYIRNLKTLLIKMDYRQDVLKARYLQDGETEEMMYTRVARAICDSEHHAKQMDRYMRNHIFLPNSPTLVNAGTTKGGLSACYVLPIEDSLESILETVYNAAMVHKFYGGTGFDLSNIRPKNDNIATTGGKSCGPVKVMRLLNESAETVSQGGHRQGANMGILRIDHPDIFEFISCKDNDGDLSHFNISVSVTDKFMEAVKKNESIPLVFNDTTYDMVNARDLFMAVVSHAHLRAEPGLIFIDTINKDNPLNIKMTATNPCGEQPLLPYESCNLGSINLSSFVSDGKFDFEFFGEVVYDAILFLDNVIDKNYYPTEKIKFASECTRKIGLGVMGWHDTLILMNISYCSNEAIDLIDQIGEVLKDRSEAASEYLYHEKGSCLADCNKRNITLTTIAPTGTLSFIAQCSSGIEPVYEWKYTRRTEQGEVEIVHPTYDLAVKHQLRGDTALQISSSWHLKHQARWQKWIDNAVSKTINLISEATELEVYSIYFTAWEMGCKGVTIYRDGCRNEQVLSSTPVKKVASEEKYNRCDGSIYKAQTGCGEIYVITGNDVDDNLVHTFVISSGGCAASNETIGRMISHAMQDDADIKDICKQLHKVNCANSNRSRKSDGKSCADVIAKCIEAEMSRLSNEEILCKVTTCPECGEHIVYEGGCASGTCKHCGWSGCM